MELTRREAQRTNGSVRERSPRTGEEKIAFSSRMEGSTGWGRNLNRRRVGRP